MARVTLVSRDIYFIKCLSVESNFHFFEIRFEMKRTRKREREKEKEKRYKQLENLFGIIYWVHSLSSAQFKIKPWRNVFIYLCVITYQMLLIDEISLYSSFLSPSLFLSVSLCFSLVYVSPLLILKKLRRVCI